MSNYQLFIKPVNGSWSDLTIPDGKRFGIQPQGTTNSRQWHSALSYIYDSPKDFDVFPICSGTMFCDFRPKRLHFEVSNFDLMHLSILGNEFVEPVVNGDYESLKLLPFPDDDVERDALYGSIHNLGTEEDIGSIKLILHLSKKDQFYLGQGLEGFGKVKYFLYDSVDIQSLYQSLGVSGFSADLKKKIPNGHLFFDANLIPKKIRKDNDVTWDHIFKLFLLGLIKARVSDPSAIRLGKPSTVENSENRKEINLWAFTEYGAVDPGLALKALHLAGKLNDSSPAVNSFFASPAEGGAIESTFLWTDQLASTQDRFFTDLSTFNEDQFTTDASSFIYPYPILHFLNEHFNWSSNIINPNGTTKWREVGDTQTGQYLEVLLPYSGTTNPQIASFLDWNDRYNLFQLEAIVRHFCKGTQSEHGTGSSIGNPVDVDISADFLTKAKLGWKTNAPPMSGVYLIQIDRISDIGGPKTGLRLEIRRPEPRAYDEYEGCIFLVSGGEIRNIIYGFSSFTGKDMEGEAASSIEGNRRYLFRSRKSPQKEGHNYAFILTRDGNLKQQGQLPAWFYWGSMHPTHALGERDENGKGGIIIHRGNPVIRRNNPSPSKWNGSHGCQVAPSKTYYPLRKAIIFNFLRDENPAAMDRPWLGLVSGLTAAESEMVYIETNNHIEYEESLKQSLSDGELYAQSEHCIDPIVSQELEQLLEDWEIYEEIRKEAEKNKYIITPEHWDNKIIGTYFLVRPFEITQPMTPETRFILRPQGI